MFPNSHASQTLIHHEELIIKTSKALSRIADALPRIELKLSLYPTPEMRKGVTDVYAYIIKFLTRTMDWYTQGKLKHLASAVFRPYELHFKDLVEEVTARSRQVDKLAEMHSQLEVRRVYTLAMDLKYSISREWYTHVGCDD